MDETPLAKAIYDSFMLEVRAGDEGKGTEGRDRMTLWFLPFGHSTENQFGEVIKMGISSFSNSYDDIPLGVFRWLIAESKRRLDEGEKR